MIKIDERLQEAGLKWKKKRGKSESFPKSYISQAVKLEKRIMDFDEQGNKNLKKEWLRKTSLNDRIFIGSLLGLFFDQMGTIQIYKPELFYEKMKLNSDNRLSKRLVKMITLRYEKALSYQTAVFKVEYQADKVKKALIKYPKETEQMMEFFYPEIKLEHLFFPEKARQKTEAKIMEMFAQSKGEMEKGRLWLNLEEWILPVILEECGRESIEKV